MKIDSNVKQALTKPLTWIAAGVVAGGITVSLLSQPTLAQLDGSDLSTPSSVDLLPPRNNRQPAAPQGDFEIKGQELRLCTSQANSDKKNCNAVASGYTQILTVANQLYSQGNIPAAESVFRQLTSSHPNEATPHYRLGNILDRQGRNDEAISQYRRAIEINSKHALARNSLGVSLARQGRLDDAISEWQEALKINPQYADALTNLGIGLLQQNKESEAIDTLKKAREIFMKQDEFAKVKQIDRILQEINSRST